jgi:hypothetical protein
MLYIYIYIYIYVYMYKYIYPYIYILLYICIYTSICMCIPRFLCAYHECRQKRKRLDCFHIVLCTYRSGYAHTDRFCGSCVFVEVFTIFILFLGLFLRQSYTTVLSVFGVTERRGRFWGDGHPGVKLFLELFNSMFSYANLRRLKIVISAGFKSQPVGKKNVPSTCPSSTP